MPLAKQDLHDYLRTLHVPRMITIQKLGEVEKEIRIHHPGLTEQMWRGYGQEREQVMQWTFCLASALKSLHSADPPLIYRDIKPQNILIRNGQVMLADFGISFTREGNTKTGATTNTHDTVQYEPLEASHAEYNGKLTFKRLHDKKGNVQYRKTILPGDIFSLGCVFYEMLRTIQLDCEYEGPSRGGDDPYDEMVKDDEFIEPFDWMREDEESLDLLPKEYRQSQFLTSFLQSLVYFVFEFRPSERLKADELCSFVEFLMDRNNIHKLRCLRHDCRFKDGVDDEEIDMEIDEEDEGYGG